jgi:hypothetical protein
MSEQAWLSYTGAITGVIGAVTGIAGAIMGYIGYRRSEELKSLDLRLELRKAANDLRSVVEELTPLLEHATKSRTAVAAATGLLGSGALKKWVSEWKVDLAAVTSMQAELPTSDADYASLGHSVLEAKLVAVHAFHAKAVRLREKYDASLAADDREREHIRADVRARTQANLEVGNEAGVGCAVRAPDGLDV